MEGDVHRRAAQPLPQRTRPGRGRIGHVSQSPFRRPWRLIAALMRCRRRRYNSGIGFSSAFQDDDHFTRCIREGLGDTP
ncbi:hypothetical protein RHCRD62_30272 [Rhodococcus sp. RD6.2]|nr:hypothetical protein RHCRD62_30272 [Rhodococcus sp. RD6.2]